MTTKIRNTITGEIIYTNYDISSTYYPWVIDIYSEGFDTLTEEFKKNYGEIDEINNDLRKLIRE